MHNSTQLVEKNYDLGLQSYKSAMDTYEAVKKRYQGGLSSSLDYSQAQSDMNSAQFTMIKNKYDLIFKSKVIDFYLGKDIDY